MDSRLINPFSLLGVSSKSTLADLKKAYYQLSLMCHPDKGGDSSDMIVVAKAYQYVKQQLEKIKDKPLSLLYISLYFYIWGDVN